jgi:hypothetical protein
MIDALLYAVRDCVIGAGYGYNVNTCDVMPDGEPKANCGDIFIAVHQGGSQGGGYGRLDEMFAFNLTLTMRCRGIPKDRVGDSLLAQKVAKSTGFNRRAEQLRAFLHENWFLLYYANNYLVEYSGDQEVVYGFCEPPRYRGQSEPHFVYGGWFSGNPEDEDVGLMAELRFDDCRRFQAIATFV